MGGENTKNMTPVRAGNGKRPELTIIIVSYDVRDLLVDCLRSLFDTCLNEAVEVIVVDNASHDGSAQMVRDGFPQVVLIENKINNGFARANNQGFTITNGEYILLLNPDTIVKPGAIQSVLEFMRRTQDAGIAACRLLNPDGTLQKSIRRLPTIHGKLFRTFHLDRVFYPESWNRTYFGHRPFRIGYPMGAFMMIRRNAIDGDTLLCPDFFMYSEEKDLALKLKRAGYYSYFVPDGEVIHYGEQSTRQASLPMFLELQKSQIIYFRKNYSGIYRHLLIWSYWLTLVTSTLASVFLSFNQHGRHRLRLFASALWRYPVEVGREVCKPWWKIVVGRSVDTIRLLYRSFSQDRVRLALDGTERSRVYYEYFTARHPRYPLIRNKTFGVALLQLPNTFDEYIGGKHREYLRRMRNRAIREGYRFECTDPNCHMDEILAINQSLPDRQGRPMEAEYFDRNALAHYFRAKQEVFAIFDRAGRLRAYAYVPVLGDVCLFDRLLGHADDLSKGIMYLLLSEVVRGMIELKQHSGLPIWVEYDTFLGGSDGIRYFKEKIGFKPRNVRWIWKDAPSAQKI